MIFEQTANLIHLDVNEFSPNPNDGKEVNILVEGEQNGELVIRLVYVRQVRIGFGELRLFL